MTRAREVTSLSVGSDRAAGWNVVSKSVSEINSCTSAGFSPAIIHHTYIKLRGWGENINGRRDFHSRKTNVEKLRGLYAPYARGIS